MIRWGRSKTRKTTKNICTHRLSHACELSTSLDPVGGKSNYSKRDRKLSQSRSNPSIYIARPGASADERKRRWEWKGMIAEGAMRVEVGPRGAYKGPQTFLSLFFPFSVSFSFSFFFFLMWQNACWKHSLTILCTFFSSRWNFCHLLFPSLPPLPLFLFLFGCISLNVLNAVTAFTYTRARSMFTCDFRDQWHGMQRSDVNVTTRHVATFNNVVKMKGRGKRSNDDSEGANATLRRNRGYKRTADGRPVSKPTTTSIARFRAGRPALLPLPNSRYMHTCSKEQQRLVLSVNWTA